jgi:hypothetical protein
MSLWMLDTKAILVSSAADCSYHGSALKQANEPDREATACL